MITVVRSIRRLDWGAWSRPSGQLGNRGGLGRRRPDRIVLASEPRLTWPCGAPSATGNGELGTGRLSQGGSLRRGPGGAGIPGWREEAIGHL